MVCYGEELLHPRPIPKFEGHILPAVRDSFNIFVATLYVWRSSPPSATRRCAMPRCHGPTRYRNYSLHCIQRWEQRILKECPVTSRGCHFHNSSAVTAVGRFLNRQLATQSFRFGALGFARRMLWWYSYYQIGLNQISSINTELIPHNETSENGTANLNKNYSEFGQ
jgi:hypothetical protein